MNKWDELYSNGAKYTPLNELYLQRLLEEIERTSKKKPTTVIDLGCGTGDALIKFAKNGLSGFGFDMSEIAINIAKEKLSEQGIRNIKVSVQDLDTLDFRQTADVILCRLTYAFIAQKENFLETVKGLMAAHSVFVLTTPVLHKDMEYTKEDKPGIAVDFLETQKLLKHMFSSVKIFNHEYFGDKGETVTFLMMK